jgi:hypothetical protein
MTHSLSSDAAWQVRIGEIVAPALVTKVFFRRHFSRPFAPPAAPY